MRRRIVKNYDEKTLFFTFLTPALPNDLDVLSRPVTYLLWEARATDGKSHKVNLYLDATSHLVVNRFEA